MQGGAVGAVEELARGAVEWMLAQAEVGEHGPAWRPVVGEAEVDPTLYHGGAGIVLALLEAHEHFGDDRYGEERESSPWPATVSLPSPTLLPAARLANSPTFWSKTSPGAPPSTRQESAGPTTSIASHPATWRHGQAGPWETQASPESYCATHASAMDGRPDTPCSGPAIPRRHPRVPIKSVANPRGRAHNRAMRDLDPTPDALIVDSVPPLRAAEIAAEWFIGIRERTWFVRVPGSGAKKSSTHTTRSASKTSASKRFP
ncbi:hypothetical protein [Nocardia sp. NPDC049149]|uniref:hypothetical protein n=1 Tax=Nocardia sp. NPDC049149 TaxID=3364315 RepID=UPI003723E720